MGDQDAESDLVIGVGNRDRGDDAIGPIVVDELRRTGDGQFATMIVEGDLSDLALRWAPEQRVVIVDALVGGGEPGTIVMWDALTGVPGRSESHVSTHGVGLADAIELGRTIGRLPHALTIVGVEVDRIEHFAPLSRPVADSVPGLVQTVRDVIGCADDQHRRGH